MSRAIPPSAPASQNVLSALAVYARMRVLIVLLLGFASGLPLALSSSTLAIWLAESKVDLATIGLLSLAGLPYTFKFFWAPLVDALCIPVLSKLLGRRRAWLVVSQLLLMASIYWLATLDPMTAPLAVGLGALMVAFASATQDIVIDAFRIESLDQDEQAAGMASYVAAYRVALLVSGAGTIAFTSWLEARGIGKAEAWRLAYMGCAGLGILGLAAALFAGEPQPAPARDARSDAAEENILRRVIDTAIGAFRSFLSKDAAIIVLIFIIAFKLCDALAGTMTGPFVLQIGYDKATYAGIVKGVGFAAAIAGGFAGGAIAKVLSMRSALWLALLLQMASNLSFTWLALQPVSPASLTAVIIVENATGAIGTIIFVAYLSRLCRSAQHTATQYALLTALASTGRTLLSSGTGYAADVFGWPLFFVATAIAGVPALVGAARAFRQDVAVSPGYPEADRQPLKCEAFVDFRDRALRALPALRSTLDQGSGRKEVALTDTA
jgi:PAT family beta-lactamase induction signal transducer AmpG